MKAAAKLAKIYGEDEEEAAFAGLIHDIAKEMPKEEIEGYVKEHHLIIDEVEKHQMGLLHAKLGASIAKERFRVSKKIENAIKYHTTGNRKMDTFAKIIYVADKMEETRTYEEIETVRKLAKKDLDEAILFCLDFITQKSIKTGKLIHPDSIDLRNDLLIKKNEI